MPLIDIPEERLKLLSPATTINQYAAMTGEQRHPTPAFVVGLFGELPVGPTWTAERRAAWIDCAVKFVDMLYTVVEEGDCREWPAGEPPELPWEADE